MNVSEAIELLFPFIYHVRGSHDGYRCRRSKLNNLGSQLLLLFLRSFTELAPSVFFTSLLNISAGKSSLFCLSGSFSFSQAAAAVISMSGAASAQLL